MFLFALHKSTYKYLTKILTFNVFPSKTKLYLYCLDNFYKRKIFKLDFLNNLDQSHFV